jgi:hypothetical protein
MSLSNQSFSSFDSLLIVYIDLLFLVLCNIIKCQIMRSKDYE